MLGIIAAMQKEADVLLLQSKDVQCAEKFGKKVYRAEFGGIPYLLVLSGIGKDNAAADERHGAAHVVVGALPREP